MPLRDHFHRPARGIWRWPSVFVVWASSITYQLNTKTLPASYVALPQMHVGGETRADIVLTLKPPPLVVPSDVADLDLVEVKVHHDEEGFRLVAAIELVSPANKDRPSHRRAFAAKCAAYLQQDVSVVVVDVVTERQENLHAELMDLLDLGEGPKSAASSELYAVAYRAVSRENGGPILEMWSEPLRVGGPLPVLPLWLSRDLAVPLDLEASYTAACESLRMK